MSDNSERPKTTYRCVKCGNGSGTAVIDVRVATGRRRTLCEEAVAAVTGYEAHRAALRAR